MATSTCGTAGGDYPQIAAQCNQIVNFCSNPPQQASFPNGIIQLLSGDAGQINSMYSLECGTGYEVSNTDMATSSTCDTGGVYPTIEAQCTPIPNFCTNPPHSTPNGIITLTGDAGQINSMYSLECDNGYEVSNTDTSTSSCNTG
eukprot:108579_1